MNDQEAFDTALFGLRKQGKAGVNESGFCRYRSADGYKCAIGMLIPDAEYKEEFEGQVSANIVRNIPSLSEVRPSLLAAMQIAHDVHLVPENFSNFELAMKRVAKSYKLTYTQPEENTWQKR